MACSQYTLNGIAQECGGSVAGLQNLYFGLVSDITGVTYTDSAQTIDTLSLASGKKIYEYYVTDESSSLSSTLTKNTQNGVQYFTNTINATFVKMTPAKHLEMQALANEKVFIIAKDNNNEYWAIGVRDSFATVGEITAQSGQAFDDLSGYQIVANHRSGFLPFSISESLVNSLLA